MYDVTIIGNGNLGYNFSIALEKAQDFKLLQWYGRNWKNKNFNNKSINKLSEIKKADLFIIAVSDDSISDILNYINKQYFVIHCSGATPIDVFHDFERGGVIFPVQTITKQIDFSFKNIPFCIESKKTSDLKLLKKLVKNLHGTFKCLDSNQRANVHLSAVWINNFVNHMISKGKKICIENNISFSLMEPILKKTVDQAISQNPDKVQTGPALRNDINTLKLHSSLIKNSDDKSLYKIITKSIQKNYEK